jgi:hypothetical protein
MRVSGPAQDAWVHRYQTCISYQNVNNLLIYIVCSCFDDRLIQWVVNDVQQAKMNNNLDFKH